MLPQTRSTIIMLDRPSVVWRLRFCSSCGTRPITKQAAMPHPSTVPNTTAQETNTGCSGLQTTAKCDVGHDCCHRPCQKGHPPHTLFALPAQLSAKNVHGAALCPRWIQYAHLWCSQRGACAKAGHCRMQSHQFCQMRRKGSRRQPAT